MKRLLALCLSLVICVVILVGCGNTGSSSDSSANGGSQQSSGEKIVWKFGHVANEDHPWQKVAEKFSELLSEKTNGRLSLEIYPNSTLGSEADVLNGISLGTADMTMTGGSFEPYAASAALLEAPWAYNNEEHVKKMLESEIGDSIRSDFEKAGYKPLFYSLRSPRNLTSNKPVKTPDDIKNVKMRISNTPLQVSMWAKAGAAPTSIALGETFTALSQGVVDMQENPYDMIYTNSFFEVQKYCNETQHVFSSIFYVVGMKQYNSLPDDMKKAVDEASVEIQDYANQLYYETKDYYKDLCVEKGMIINTDVDREAFRKAMMPAIKEFFKPEIYEMYEKIVALDN